MAARSNLAWRLIRRPDGFLRESDLELVSEPIPQLRNGEVLIRHVYLSLDPICRLFLREEESFVPPVDLGQVMLGIGIGVVEESLNPGLRCGEVIRGFLGWQEHTVTKGEGLERLSRYRPFPLADYLAVLGHVGLAAYHGLLEAGRPKQGETLVVSAGAVGFLAGQIGKIYNCRVVGIAPNEEKRRWMKNDLGFDAAVDYGNQPIVEALRAACPDGIDIYFDTFGGAVLDAALRLINMKARIVQGGMISLYNSDWDRESPGLPHLVNLQFARARIQGFIWFDYPDKDPEALRALGRWLAEGKLKHRVQVVCGLENAPAGLNRNLDGSNIGKLLCKVSEEPGVPGREGASSSLR